MRRQAGAETEPHPRKVSITSGQRRISSALPTQDLQLHKQSKYQAYLLFLKLFWVGEGGGGVFKRVVEIAVSS